MPLCSTHGQMKAEANLLKGVAFGFEKRDAGITPLPCRTLEDNQYDTRVTKIPQIRFAMLESKYWDESIEKKSIECQRLLEFGRVKFGTI